jgi:hypothetical protein
MKTNHKYIVYRSSLKEKVFEILAQIFHFGNFGIANFLYIPFLYYLELQIIHCKVGGLDIKVYPEGRGGGGRSGGVWGRSLDAANRDWRNTFKGTQE